MSNEQTGLVPPIVPPVPQVPPPQTVIGLLSEDGLPSIFDLPMSGQPPSDEFWKSREELITTFNWSTTQTQTTNLITIDVLGGVEDINNHNFRWFINRALPANLNVVVPVCNLVFPRSLLSRSFEYFEGPIKFTFWAIKAVGPKGKLRIMYSPNQKNAAFTDAPLYDSTHLRTNMWEWDLEKQDVFEVEVFGNNPIGKFYQDRNALFTDNTNILNDSRSQQSTGAINLTEQGFNFFSTTMGCLSIQVQNRYIPGSIFADNCDIMVFKSIPKVKHSLLRGPRNMLYNRLI